MKGHAVPPSKEAERRGALLTLNIPAMRAWMTKYAIGALGDDRTVLISMHETRVVDPAMGDVERRASVAWLKVEYPESAVLKEGDDG